MNIANRGKIAVLVVACVVSMLAWNGPARAEEETTAPAPDAAGRLEALEQAVSDHKRAEDSEALIGDVQRIVALHADAARDEKVRKGAVKLLGGLTRSRRTCSAVVVAAFEGLGKTGDPDASGYVKTRLRRLRGEDVGSAPMKAAVAAAAKLCTDALIEPLLKIVEDSRDVTLAAAAVQALGNFHQCKRKRERILLALVETVAKDRPGTKGRNKDPVPGDQYRNTGDLARRRWAALSRVMPAALCALTRNEDMKSADMGWWIEIVRDHKRDLGTLFVDPED